MHRYLVRLPPLRVAKMAMKSPDEPIPADSAAEPGTPTVGGGWPVIDGWAKASLSLQGPLLWSTLLHKSACLSCAWGTGGQNGGFSDELGEPLQRCLKSVEAISAELQAAVPKGLFGQRSIAQLQQLSSLMSTN